MDNAILSNVIYVFVIYLIIYYLIAYHIIKYDDLIFVSDEENRCFSSADTIRSAFLMMLIK